MTISGRAFLRLILAGAVAAGAGLDSPAGLASPLSPQEPDSAAVQSERLTDFSSEPAMQALGLLGVRYRYGGTSPQTGFDCSGLVRYAFVQAWGIMLPRTAEEMSQIGESVDEADLRAGDLVFYNTLHRRFSHVGIYLGNRRFIHAPSSGGRVRIESMETIYWVKRFNGARRIRDPSQPLPVTPSDAP